MNRRAFLACSGGAALLALGCTRLSDITVGSKNFVEQLILGELILQHLQRRLRQRIDERFYLAGSYICHQAILAGRIDAYVEYTGTALAAILKQSPQRDKAEVFSTVQREYSRRFGLEVFPSLGFNNSFAIVMRPDDAQRLSLRTLSDLARVSNDLRIGIGYEFLDRADGFKPMCATYDLRFAAPPQVMDLGLIYRALLSKQVDVVAGSNTDGQIAALGLAVLPDDRDFFPPYDAVPIVRQATLQRVSGLRDAFTGLSGAISADAMRRMNYEAEAKKKDAAAIALDFLQNNPTLRAAAVSN